MSEEPIPHPVDPDTLWDFADPAGSEGRFRAALTTGRVLAPDARAEIHTQIARAHAGLVTDPWLVEHEPDRLNRLQDLATAAPPQEVTDA